MRTHARLQVQVYLDDSGSLQVSKLMSVQTTIQGLFSQLPQLAHNLLQVVLDNSPPLASSFQLRLVCDFPDICSTTDHSFDLPIHSSVTLEEIMHEYIPGTFQLSFRLLYQGEPVNLAALILEQLEKSYEGVSRTRKAPQSSRHQPVQQPVQQLRGTAYQCAPTVLQADQPEAHRAGPAQAVPRRQLGQANASEACAPRADVPQLSRHARKQQQDGLSPTEYIGSKRQQVLRPDRIICTKTVQFPSTGAMHISSVNPTNISWLLRLLLFLMSWMVLFAAKVLQQ